MVTVLVPPPLQGPTKGVGTVQVSAATMREAIDAIDALHAGFKCQIVADDGNPHKFIRLFLNGTMVHPNEWDEAVAPQDEIEIVAALAGG